VGAPRNHTGPAAKPPAQTHILQNTRTPGREPLCPGHALDTTYSQLGAGSASHAMRRLVRPLIIEAGMAAPNVPKEPAKYFHGEIFSEFSRVGGARTSPEGARLKRLRDLSARRETPPQRGRPSEQNNESIPYSSLAPRTARMPYPRQKTSSADHKLRCSVAQVDVLGEGKFLAAGQLFHVDVLESDHSDTLDEPC
jgi:hypothetical protein